MRKAGDDLIRRHIEVRRKFRWRRVALEGSHCHLRLERSRVVPPFPSCHVLASSYGRLAAVARAGLSLVALPYFPEPGLGTPYGASHVSGSDGDTAGSENEKLLALALGRRLAETAKKLAP